MVPGATARLKDPSGATAGSGVTDQDGYCMINYKATGKTPTDTVTIVAPGGFT